MYNARRVMQKSFRKSSICKMECLGFLCFLISFSVYEQVSVLQSWEQKHHRTWLPTSSVLWGQISSLKSWCKLIEEAQRSCLHAWKLSVISLPQVVKETPGVFPLKKALGNHLWVLCLLLCSWWKYCSILFSTPEAIASCIE